MHLVQDNRLKIRRLNLLRDSSALKKLDHCFASVCLRPSLWTEKQCHVRDTASSLKLGQDMILFKSHDRVYYIKPLNYSGFTKCSLVNL